MRIILKWIKETGLQGVEWINLARDWDRLRHLVNTAWTFRFYKILLISWLAQSTVSYSTKLCSMELVVIVTTWSYTKSKMTGFWDTAPFGLIAVDLWEHTALYPRGLSSSYSPSREPEISLIHSRLMTATLNHQSSSWSSSSHEVRTLAGTFRVWWKKPLNFVLSYSSSVVCNCLTVWEVYLRCISTLIKVGFIF